MYEINTFFLCNLSHKSKRRKSQENPQLFFTRRVDKNLNECQFIITYTIYALHIKQNLMDTSIHCSSFYGYYKSYKREDHYLYGHMLLYKHEFV